MGSMRSGAAIRHRFVLDSATHPLSRPPLTEASGLRRLSERPTTLPESFHEEDSTCGDASSILVHVHLGPSCQPVRFDSFQIDESRLDGQPFSRNNVLAHHT